jgi:hypothetical protein
MHALEHADEMIFCVAEACCGVVKTGFSPLKRAGFARQVEGMVDGWKTMGLSELWWVDCG